jgi:predicted 3-demethylubiquinone-9 3-methyltransferase (glyoxalase superfamily)
MQKITPFLWFDHQAEEAANLYVSLIPNSKIVSVARYGDAGPGPKGQVMTVNFRLAGQSFVALNGGPLYKFTEAISFLVNVETQAELDRLWTRLLDGGQPQQCGWLKDKFGLSWQIVPSILAPMLQDRDPVRARRVMEAMLKMVKLDIRGLEEAYGRPEPRPARPGRSSNRSRASRVTRVKSRRKPRR